MTLDTEYQATVACSYRPPTYVHCRSCNGVCILDMVLRVSERVIGGAGIVSRASLNTFRPERRNHRLQQTEATWNQTPRLHHSINRYCSFNYQNQLFCRLPFISRQGLTIGTYKNHGFGSQRYHTVIQIWALYSSSPPEKAPYPPTKAQLLKPSARGSPQYWTKNQRNRN